MADLPLRRAAAAWIRDMRDAGRIVLAVKTALAAAVAWYLAPFVPFADDQYSYYAPLGVLVSMYPTLAGSVRAGMQALIGLALGIGLGLAGLAADLLAIPRIAILAVVIALGVLLSGIRALGAGRDWIAIAALFVLLSSGGEANTYSLSYLVNMGFGVLVGVIVNLLILPPLHLERAALRLSDLRTTLAARLDEMADALEQETIERVRLQEMMEDVRRVVDAVRADVTVGDQSGKGNPRAKRRLAEQQENLHRMRALESTAFFVRDLADVLIRMTGRDDPSLSADVRGSFTAALRRCGDLVAIPVGAPESLDRLRQAEASLDRYLSALDAAIPARPSGAADELTAAVCLQRIVDASRPLVSDG